MLSVQIHGFVQLQTDAFRVINQEKSLKKGVWYPVEYLEALQRDLKEKDGPRVQWMKEKENCRLGFVDPKTFDRRDDFTFVAKHYAARPHEKMREVLMDPAGAGPAIHYYMIRGGKNQKNITLWFNR